MKTSLEEFKHIVATSCCMAEIKDRTGVSSKPSLRHRIKNNNIDQSHLDLIGNGAALEYALKNGYVRLANKITDEDILRHLPASKHLTDLAIKLGQNGRNRRRLKARLDDPKFDTSHWDKSVIQMIIRQVKWSLQAPRRGRKLVVELSNDEIGQLIFANCYYCGQEPSNKVQLFPHYRISGIDRVDNSKGYVKGNCVPCCRDCNSIKNAVTVDMARKMIEFLDSSTQNPPTPISIA